MNLLIYYIIRLIYLLQNINNIKKRKTMLNNRVFELKKGRDGLIPTSTLTL